MSTEVASDGGPISWRSSATPTQCARADELCTIIYDAHPCGCCWHITLDDGNVEDHSVAFCIGIANETPEQRKVRLRDPEGKYPCKTPDACREIGPIMLLMTEEQRARVRCMRSGRLM